MYKLHKSIQAEEDLTDIWIYTLQEWGVDQADRYIDELEAGLARLESNPKLGRSREQLRRGYFSLRLNEHVAFYVVTASVIRIVRVLHSRMDPDRHL